MQDKYRISSGTFLINAESADELIESLSIQLKEFEEKGKLSQGDKLLFTIETTLKKECRTTTLKRKKDESWKQDLQMNRQETIVDQSDSMTDTTEKKTNVH